MSRKVSAQVKGTALRGLAALPDPVLRALTGRAIRRDGQVLHPETQLALRLRSLTGSPELSQLSVAQARNQVAEEAGMVAGRRVDVDEVRDLTLSGAAGPIAARLYVPDRGARALVVYYHGGGFVVGDLDTHDNACRFLARSSGVRVIAVDYRRAPESPFPAALADALAAFQSAAARASELGAEPDRVAVAGDSAGGNLAVGVARLSRDAGPAVPAFQLLFYPWLDLAEKRDSYRLFGEGFYLTESDLDWYRSHYLAVGEQSLDPRCSPLRSDDLVGVAPAYIASAGFDPLRDDAEAFAGRLSDAGVSATLRRHAELIHGFFNTVAVGHACRDAVLEASGALRRALLA